MLTHFKRTKCFFAAFLALVTLLLSLPGFRAEISRRVSAERAAEAHRRIKASTKGLCKLVSKNSEIYYKEADIEYAETARRIISTYLPLLSADFGLSEIPKVIMIIYPDKETMYSFIGYNPDETEGSPNPTGAYSAGILAVLPPGRTTANGRSDIDAFLSETPVIHELCHLLLDKKTNGNYSQWFAEGVALYYENRYLGRAPANVNSTSVSYVRLSESFRYVNERESYRKSYAIIKYLVDFGGEKALRRIFGELAEGMSINSSLRGFLGKSFSALDKL